MPRKLFVRIGADDSELQKKLKGIANNMYSWGKDLEKIGRTLTRTLTVPIAGLAAGVFAFSEKAKAAFKSFGEEVKTSLGRVGDDVARAINLTGILEKISRAVKWLADMFIALPDPVKRFMVAMLAMAAILGPVILLISKFALLIATAAAALSGPFGLIITIASLTAGVIALEFAQSKSAQSLDDLNESTKTYNDLLADRAVYEKAVKGIPAPPMAKIPAWWAEEFKNKLKEINEEIKNIEGEMENFANKGTIYTEDVQKGFEQMQSAVSRIDADMRVNGVSVDKLKAKYQELNNFLVTLSEAGFSKTDTMWQDTQEQMDMVVAKYTELQAKAQTLAGAWDVFIEKIKQIPPLAVQVGTALADIFFRLTESVGNALAQVLVYGKSLKEAFKEMAKSILANIISMFVTIALQQLAALIVGRSYASGIASANIGASVGRAGAAGFAASVESFGIAGIFAGPAWAAAAIAGASLAGEAGIAAGSAIGAGGTVAAASGGLFKVPSFATLAEREPELVIPLSRVDRILGRGGPIHVHVDVDGREIAKATLMNAPGIMRTYGVA